MIFVGLSCENSKAFFQKKSYCSNKSYTLLTVISLTPRKLKTKRDFMGKINAFLEGMIIMVLVNKRQIDRETDSWRKFQRKHISFPCISDLMILFDMKRRATHLGKSYYERIIAGVKIAFNEHLAGFPCIDVLIKFHFFFFFKTGFNWNSRQGFQTTSKRITRTKFHI